jgi:hypothetical protein
LSFDRLFLTAPKPQRETVQQYSSTAAHLKSLKTVTMVLGVPIDKDTINMAKDAIISQAWWTATAPALRALRTVGIAIPQLPTDDLTGKVALVTGAAGDSKFETRLKHHLQVERVHLTVNVTK